MKFTTTLLLVTIFCCSVSAQQSPDTVLHKNTDSLEKTATADSIMKTQKNRKLIIGTLSGAAYAGSLYALNEAWYKNYPKASFHTFNDAGEWLQMDKVGHAWTAYNISRGATAMWKWAGVKPEKAVWIGSFSGFTYLTVIELLDGYSAEWGWSWADMGANIAGSALFASQELLWKEQRVSFKFSALPQTYNEDLKQRAGKLFGTSLPEKILKDYNAQTYWLSANLGSFFKNTNLPSCLNIAIGYGASGMFGGYQNRALDQDGSVIFDRTDIPRKRQWYLSADIDLTRIKTGNKTLKTIFSAFNVIKIPAPALELSQGKLKGHWLYF